MFWFTADLHLNHEAVLRHSNRPFASLNEMNDVLIKNINDRVDRNDTLIIVGDFCWRRSTTAAFRQRLNVRNILVAIGNHDQASNLKTVFGKDQVKDILEIKVPLPDGNKQLIIACHYSMRVWNKSHYGTWHVYGHSHGRLSEELHSLSCDVGVDCWDYAPVSFDILAAHMLKKQRQI